jgi:hypothetical protein
MATDSKILWFGAGVVGTILLLRYYSKKKDVKVTDLKNQNPPIIVGVPDPTPPPQQRSSGLTANPLTLNAFGSGVKPPIYMSAQNLVPNIYDRGVGAPLFANADAAFEDSKGIQNRCRCAVNNRPQRSILSQFNP